MSDNPGVRAAARAVELAMDNWLWDMEYRVARGKLTAADVAEAVDGWPDFDDAWRNWLVENGYSPEGIKYDTGEEYRQVDDEVTFIGEPPCAPETTAAIRRIVDTAPAVPDFIAPLDA